MNKINIAIDGFSGCGKSTLAKDLAYKLDYTFIDSGAMFRAIAFLAEDDLTEENIALLIEKEPKIEFDSNGHLILDGVNRSKEIRSAAVTSKVSLVAQLPEVRNYIKQLQDELIKKKGVVMEGRDITSVIMPNAELKLFITAEPKVRAQRRFDQLLDQGKEPSIDQVLESLLERDRMDIERDIAPLKLMDSVIVLDTTQLTREAQLDACLALASPKIFRDKLLGSLT